MSGLLAVGITSSWGSDFVNNQLPKFGTMMIALIGFFAIVLLVFYAAGLVRGRAANPVTVLVFVVPAIALVGLGLIYPAILTTIYSLKGASGTKFVGLANYTWAFTNPDMRRVFLNTIIWLFVAPLFSTGLGLLLALFIDRMKRESVPKSLIFMPMAISFVGASIIFKFIYDYREPSQPQIGLLSQVCLWIGIKNPPNWLLWQPWNNFLLMVIMIWIQTGFAMVVLSAAIKAIPTDVIEAAAIDGAKGFRMFASVTVPMIRGTLIVVLTTIMIATLKIFDIVRTMTGGNFGTQVLSNEMYSQTFVQFNQGRGSALAVILFIAVIPIVAYNVVQLRKERTIR